MSRDQTLRFIAAAACACLGLPVAIHRASAQSSGAASAPRLTPYTAPDQSASAGVPPGWKVTKGDQTVIIMTGPSGETISLGNTVVARNAAFQLGQKAVNGIDFSMPASATPAQKFTWILQQNAAVDGKSAPQISITSSAPLQLPATLGQCGRIVASVNGASGPMTLAALLCSLPVDSGGTYKVMMKVAQAPPAVGKQESALASAVFTSYQIPQSWLAKKLAPHTPAPAASPASAAMTNAGTAAILRSTAAAQAASLNSANCFDLAVLRETPQGLLPHSCGGLGPN